MSPGLQFDDRRIGPVHIARSHVPDDLDVVATSSDVYALTIVGAGALHIDEAPHQQWTITPRTAGLYRPPRRPRRSRIAARTDMTCLRIGRHDLERHLEERIEQYVQGPVDFHPELPLRGNPVWLRLFRVFADVFEDPDSPVHRPMVAEPLREALIDTLLYAADHPYQALLRRRITPARPRHVRVAVEAIRAEPEHAFTVAMLAGIAGVSVRSLQQGFRDHIGMSPIAYLRRVRLARAHDDLLRDGTTVAQTAHRWGFTHLGRFAAAYASVYGVAPSLTRSTRY